MIMGILNKNSLISSLKAQKHLVNKFEMLNMVIKITCATSYYNVMSSQLTK